MSHLFIFYKDGQTALMGASDNGHLDVVRTLLEGGADVNAQTEVSNQTMMMILIIIKVLTIMMNAVFND